MLQRIENTVVAGKILRDKKLREILGGWTGTAVHRWVKNRELARPITGRNTYGDEGYCLVVVDWDDNSPSSTLVR